MNHGKWHEFPIFNGIPGTKKTFPCSIDNRNFPTFFTAKKRARGGDLIYSQFNIEFRMCFPSMQSSVFYFLQWNNIFSRVFSSKVLPGTPAEKPCKTTYNGKTKCYSANYTRTQEQRRLFYICTEECYEVYNAEEKNEFSHLSLVSSEIRWLIMEKFGTRNFFNKAIKLTFLPKKFRLHWRLYFFLKCFLSQ